MIGFTQFVQWYAFLAVVAVANSMSCFALWHAGTRKYSKQKMWARRLWQLNTVYILILFLWSLLYLVRVKPPV